jgi:hypothetical protein
MAYRFNNLKLKKIINIQKKQLQIEEAVDALKGKLRLWRRFKNSAFGNVYDNTDVDTQQPHSEFNLPLAYTKKKINPIKDEIFSTHLRRKGDNSYKKIFNIDDLYDPDLYNERLEKDLKIAKDQLPFWAGWYNTFKHSFTDSVVFVYNKEAMTAKWKDYKEGETKVHTDLEDIMILDLKDRLLQIQNGEIRLEDVDIDNIKFQEMVRTSQFMKFQNLFPTYMKLIFQIFLCNLDFFVYLSMIYSMMENAGFISIIYPFSVFGYALLEEIRPTKYYWDFMLKYTIVILFIKFAVNLELFDSTFESDFYMDLQSSVKIGFYELDDLG